MNGELPKIMKEELANCRRSDCRVVEARGEYGSRLINNALDLECTVCGQIWSLVSSGGHFEGWDKLGTPHYAAVFTEIHSKWPKGECQVESVEGLGAWRTRRVDATRPE